MIDIKRWSSIVVRNSSTQVDQHHKLVLITLILINFNLAPPIKIILLRPWHHYDKVIDREESVDVFAELDTRKLEHKTLL